MLPVGAAADLSLRPRGQWDWHIREMAKRNIYEPYVVVFIVTAEASEIVNKFPSSFRKPGGDLLH